MVWHIFFLCWVSAFSVRVHPKCQKDTITKTLSPSSQSAHRQGNKWSGFEWKGLSGHRPFRSLSRGLAMLVYCCVSQHNNYLCKNSGVFSSWSDPARWPRFEASCPCCCGKTAGRCNWKEQSNSMRWNYSSNLVPAAPSNISTVCMTSSAPLWISQPEESNIDRYVASMYFGRKIDCSTRCSNSIAPDQARFCRTIHTPQGHHSHARGTMFVSFFGSLSFLASQARNCKQGNIAVPVNQSTWCSRRQKSNGITPKRSVAASQLPFNRSWLYWIIPILSCYFRHFGTMSHTMGHHFDRIGEASNPGPVHQQEFVTIGNINPTQLYQKEEIVASFGSGIWTFSETSHTSLTRGLSQRRFQSLGFQTQWSADCDPLEPKKGMFRGKASGTCIASSYPMRGNHYGLSSQVLATKRYCEAIIQLSHDTCMLVISLYGPTYGSTYSNPERLLEEITMCAFDRAFNFKGPAIICGDLNVDLTEVNSWDRARQKGWQDLHLLSSTKNEHEVEPTCRNARHSFLLGNAMISQALIRCRTYETFDFSMHPVLFAELSMTTVTKHRVHWRLPKSCDDMIIDKELYAENVNRNLQKTKNAILTAVHASNSDTACKLFNQVYEASIEHSVVQPDGTPDILPRACLGKTKTWPFVSKPPSQPVCRIGRPGDIQPIGMQTTIEIRRLLQQSRRIQSLQHQLKACNRRPSLAASFQCQQLWEAILAAKGFHHSFAHWIHNHCEAFVPVNCPTIEYVEQVSDVFNKFYRNKAQHQFLVRKRNRRNSIALDIAKGGSKMFAEAREPSQPPLDQVAWSDRWPLVREKWTKQGKTCIRLQHHACNVHDTVCFQGQTAHVVGIQNNLVLLDRKFFLRSGGDQWLERHNRSADPEDMHRETAKAWNTFWQRDSNANTQQWEDCAQFMTCLADCPSLQFEEFQIPLWMDVVKRIPTRSARGSCSYSKKDLLQTPDEHTSLPFILLASFESGGKWPTQWSIARVTCLRKGDVVNSPLDLRPITVMSRIYRCWSAYRSKQVLAHLSGLIPNQVAGNCGKVSADQLAALTLLEVDMAKSTGSDKVGCVLDLRKCYNLIPRLPMLTILFLLGIPRQYIQGLDAMFSSMMRIFEIGGCLGHLHCSTTGIAEGCSFSVACMVALTYFATKTIEDIPTVNPIAFAGNWSMICDTIPALKQGLHTWEQLIIALRMDFSPEKSWLWTVKPKRNRALMTCRLQGKPIPIKTTATDLGCDVAYRSKISKKKIVQRMKKARSRLKKLGGKKLPFSFKKKIAVASGHGTMTYGSEVTYITPRQWHQLRSATTESLNLNKSGASPWLALGCVQPTLDPQLRGIIRRINFWKRFFRTFPKYREYFLHAVADSRGSKYTPSGSFRASMYDIGWTCEPNGWIQHHSGVALHWTQQSRKFITKLLSRMWTYQVMSKITHRKNVDVTTFDFLFMQKIVQTKTPQEQAILMSYFSGIHFTFDIISRYSDMGTSQCPFCEEPDSREHRFLYCKSLEHHRIPFKKAFRWLREQPTAVVHFGLCPYDDSWVRTHTQQSEVSLPFEIPEQDEAIKYVFTDGSADDQKHWEYTIAGGAFVIVDSHLSFQGSKSVDFPLIGPNQNSYRAEIFAILMCLNHVWSPHIFSDCLSAVQTFQQMTRRAAMGFQYYYCEDWDIWGLIWKHVLMRSTCDLQITHVESHRDFKLLSPLSFEQWTAYWNDVVDKAAKKVVQQTLSRNGSARQSSQKITEEIHKYFSKLSSFFVVLPLNIWIAKRVINQWNNPIKLTSHILFRRDHIFTIHVTSWKKIF